MKVAAELATQFGKPWVLNPVSAEASSFWLKSCLELMGLNPTAIRRNGYEIIAISKASHGSSKVLKL